MKNYVIMITLTLLCGVLNAAPGADGGFTTGGTTFVNEYAQVTGITNTDDITITVSDINDLDANQSYFINFDLSPGDMIMLYQAQGASYTTPADNSATYGAFSIGNSGRYEFHEVLSVNGNDIVVAENGNLCQPDQVIYSYDSTNTQVVRVPQFTSVTIAPGGNIIPTPWNGSVGGIVAMHVSGTVTVDGTIDVSGSGFRGGVLENLTSPTNESRPNYYYPSANDGAEKGESILGFQTEYDAYGGRYGRGAPANGGGGGNGHNAGGGGGANGDSGIGWNGQGNPDLSGTNWNQAWDIDGTLNSATTSSGGGRGGYTYGANDLDALSVPPGDPTWGGNSRMELGGLGGRPVPFNDASRLFFGGGGGAGDGNNNQGASGGAGGGLVFIIADQVTGSGQILANGAQGEDTQGGGNNDAPGGGGAGGTVVVSANTLSSVAIQADGGRGGHQLPIGNENEGPGGGGGGGVIALSGGATSTSALGGANGISQSTAVTEFVPNGATFGGNGQPNETTRPVADLPICYAPAPSADVAITKTLNTAGPYSNGQSIQYTLEVSNNGPDTATNVQVTDTPSNLTINSVSSTNCSAFPCTIPSLANPGSETITVTATINSSGAFDNATSVSANETDPDSSNNTDNTGNGGSAGTSADMQVVKTLTSTGPYIAGDTVTYNITVTNNGPDTANNVQVTDTPTNLTITSVSSGNCSAFPCTIVSMTNGASEVIAVSATIDATGAFDNSATVIADETDPDSSNNTDNTGNGGSAGASADMQVVKTLTSTGPYIAGDTVTYNITVTNNGPDTANNVQVTDTPTNLTITSVSSGNCSAFPCTIASMTNGASEVIAVSATIDATGAFDNSATVIADETDPDSSNNTDNTGNGGSAGTSADMQVVKTLTSTGPYIAGDTVTYNITVTNNGPDTANNVQVTDTPTNLTITSVSSGNCSAFPCTIVSMTNGASEVIAVSATIDATGAFDNVADVTADETDPDNTNNDDNTGNGGTAGTSADMSIVKNLDTIAPYNSGQSIQYSLLVTNNGPDTANNVLVTDTPTNLTITSVSSVNCSALPCTIPSMTNGSTETITVTATIDGYANFDNAATVAADETDPVSTNNQDNTGNGGTVTPPPQPVPTLNYLAIIILISLMGMVGMRRRLT